MKNSKISICNTTVHPGESASLALPLPEEYSCAPLFMPIKVIHGKKAGPCIVIFSTLQGAELNGLEIANRVTGSIDVDKISGTVISIPVMNVYGLTHYPTTLPNGGSLAKCFPGDSEGSYGQRLAHLVTQEILRKANYCIELQTGGINHNILPQVYCNFANRESKEIAKVFNTPVVTDVILEGNRLRETTENLQVPLLVYQAGEALRFDENSIELGVDGVKNVMRFVGILSDAPVQDDNTPIFSQDEDWIVAPKGGILHPNVSLGQTISSSEVVGLISDPFGTNKNAPIKAPQKGIVVGVNTSPIVHEGLPVFKIASFIDYDKAENAIENWDKSQNDPS